MSRAKGLESMKMSPAARMREQIASGGKHQGSYEKALGHAEKLEELNATNLPGLFKSMATKPGQTMKAMGGYEWHSNPGVAGKTMAFGLPAAYVGQSALAAPGEGETRIGNALSAAGEGLAFAAPLGTTASTLLGGAVGSGSRSVGRMFTPKKTKTKDLGGNTEAPVLEEGAEANPVAHEYSDRATGDIQL